MISQKIQLQKKIENAINNGIYTNPNLTLTDFSKIINTPSKELSKYINEVYQMNFSEFLNFHRVEKVKQLLANPDTEKFTLVTIANDAGFSSKSSFNTSFKKVTGMTPSTYKRKNLQS